MDSPEVQRARGLSLRDAFEEFYDTTELTQRTVAKYRHVLSAWERHTANPPVAVIDDDDVATFRASCLAAELSPATGNGPWGDVRAILNRLGPRRRAIPVASVSSLRRLG